MRRYALLALAAAFAASMSIGSVAATAEPYATGRIIVAFRTGTQPLHDPLVLASPEADAVRNDAAQHRSPHDIPAYTNDVETNRALASVGAYRIEHVFKGVVPSASPRPTGIDISNAYVVYIAGVSVRDAVNTLRTVPTVAYASPDWRVDTMNH